MDKIIIPPWVKTSNYRTMTDGKKEKAVNGSKKYQYEWMVEEINEFYEALSMKDEVELRDEAVGLIRAYQQFMGSKRVCKLWEKVKGDVRKVFPTKKIFLKAFKKWKIKKTKKKQALGVEAEQIKMTLSF
jgi:hypothetical protein